MNPTKCNGLDAANIQPAETYQGNQLNFPTAERQSKARATANDSLGQHGFQVRPNPDGGFLVSAYGLNYYAQDLEALQDFAYKVE